MPEYVNHGDGPDPRKRNPQRAVGRTICSVELWDWRHEIYFTDGTKLQIEPAEEGEQHRVEMIFQDDPATD